ncbi:hypothetical protein [Luteolibacter sp. AS25]|uniref:hypothetical protein n=1 Tax=Luteolibacter sp. AS25 TaxID=3135776 RepID=UPI00398A8950
MLICTLVQLTFQLAAYAGTGDWWRQWPEDAGVLVDEPDSVWLQYLKFGGYAHMQAAVVDGETAAGDFSYTRHSDWRRARGVVKARMLDAVDFNTQLNLVQDEGRSGGGVEFDYFSVFSADLTFDLAQWLDLGDTDSLKISYGKRKLVELNEEIETSINSILTVERSALAGLLAPFREGTGTTGGWMKMKRGEEQFSLGLFTTDSSAEFGGWDEGTVFLAGWRHDFAESWKLDEATVSVSAAWQDAGANDELYSTWEWVVTPWMRLEHGRWGLRVSGALGQNEDKLPGVEGTFGGIVIMPSLWLIEDHLQGVVRYEVIASEGPQGLTLPSRYAREAGLAGNEGIPALAAGVGDFHESVYTGLIWTIVPKRFTMLTGLEWERLESKDSRVYQGLTGWFSARIVF